MPSSLATEGARSTSRDHHDVLIVGYGPVGQTIATLLAQAGHRVAVIERHERLYPHPRAGLVDHEVMRILQSIGVADEVSAEATVPVSYEWRDASGKVLLPLTFANGPSGWSAAYCIYQPHLEGLLDGAARAAGVDLRVGCEAMSMRSSDDGVELDFRDRDGREKTVAARFLVGADGADSFVRESVGARMIDLGFRYDWIVVDLEPLRPLGLSQDPYQICDPARPTTVVPLGHEHRRFEFMLLPGEDPHEMSSADAVWTLLSPWLTPNDARLLRHPVYTFRAMYAETWRNGPVFLTGDAAHLMPPFLGQGMCSGIRDAKNLAWKLDLALRGVAENHILDSYATERLPQVEFLIHESVELGRVICVTDADEAAERDAMIVEQASDRAAAKAANPNVPAPTPSPPRLVRGLLMPDDPLAGSLSHQGRVVYNGRRGLFDDVVGRGFTLLGFQDPASLLDRGHLSSLERIGTTVAGFGRSATRGFTDVDGTYARWLDAHDACAVLTRPDFYVYGCAASSADVPSLVDGLLDQLRTCEGTGIA